MLLEDIVAVGAFTTFVAFLFILTRRMKERSKKRAEAWLAVSRVILSQKVEDIEDVIMTHEKFLDRHMLEALEKRKADLELLSEIDATVEQFRKKNDLKCN